MSKIKVGMTIVAKNGIAFTVAAAGERDGTWVMRSPKGNEAIVAESSLLAAIEVQERDAALREKLTPDYIRSLSSKDYAALLKEVGQERIEKALNQTAEPVEQPENEKVEIAQEFFKRYPQVERTEMNVIAIVGLIESRGIGTFTLADFENAFAELGPRGKITINLRAVGIPDEKYGYSRIDDYNGVRLLSSQDFDKVMSPAVVKSDDPFASLSSKDMEAVFSQVDKEMKVQRPVPPLMVAAREKMLASWFAARPEFASADPEILLSWLSERGLPVNFQDLDLAAEFLTQDGQLVPGSRAHQYGGTTLTDMGGRARGAPVNPQPSVVQVMDRPKRWTLAQVDAMTADEYSQNMQNPAFREAVDSFKK